MTTAVRYNSRRLVPVRVAARTLVALLLLGLTACSLAWPAGPSSGAKQTQSLPTSAAPDDVGVIENVGVLETPDAVAEQTLTSPVVGTLFEPAHLVAPVPAVLLLGGSEGYVTHRAAGGFGDLGKHLAAQGYVTLDLCYFGCSDRPQYLNRISLEYVLSAVSYLRSLPAVDANSVNVMGGSRGAELALLIGTYSQDVRSVISIYGSPWVFGGLVGLGLAGKASGDCAWTMNGSCLPPGMLIPVEQIRGLVLLFHGQYDALWPMAFSEQVSAELDRVQHPHSLTVFPNVGHTFGSLNCLIGADICGEGGARLVSVPWDAAANVQATRVMFAQVLALLRSEATGTDLALPGSIGAVSGLPTATVPSPLPTPAGPPGSVVIRDTLQDPTTGLLSSSSDDPTHATGGYSSGKYVIAFPAEIGRPPESAPQVVTPVVASVPGTYADATVSIDARLVNPAADQLLTVACRSQRAGYEYRLEVAPFSGQFFLSRWDGVAVSRFTPLLDSPAIHTGADTNSIELGCAADRIEARANGSLLWSVSDYTFRAGGFWFAVSQGPVPSGGGLPLPGLVQAEFSNLVVTQQ